MVYQNRRLDMMKALTNEEVFLEKPIHATKLLAILNEKLQKTIKEKP